MTESVTHRPGGAAVCPKCGARNDAHTGGSDSPEAGDISLCMYCGTPGIFVAPGETRPLTAQEFDCLARDAHFQAIVARLGSRIALNRKRRLPVDRRLG